MRTPLVKPISLYVRTKQDDDLAWVFYPQTIQSLDARTGVVDRPNWRALVKDHVDATNPYGRTIWPAQSSSLPREVNWKWQWKELFTRKVRDSFFIGHPCFGSLASHTFVSGIPQTAAVGRAESTARLAFLSKIREARGDFQALPFLGELKETLQLVRHPIRGITRVNRSSEARFRSLWRLYRSKPGRLEEKLENAYLQWTYGVSPLINDIQGLISNIKSLFDDTRVQKVRVTIPIPDSRVWSQAGLQYYEGSTQVIGYHHEITCSGSVRIAGALKNELQPASIEKFNALNGLELRDIVPAVWELTPYSFLVDYFVNIGDVLGGFFTDTSSLVYAVQSTRLKQRGLGFSVGLPTKDPVSWPLGVVSGNFDKVSLNRVKADLTVGIRDISWQDTTIGQLMNTAILSSQRLRSVAMGHQINLPLFLDFRRHP